MSNISSSGARIDYSEHEAAIKNLFEYIYSICVHSILKVDF